MIAQPFREKGARHAHGQFAFLKTLKGCLRKPVLITMLIKYFLQMDLRKGPRIPGI